MVMSRPYQIARLAAVFLSGSAPCRRSDELESAVHAAAKLLELAEDLYPDREGGGVLRTVPRAEADRSGARETEADLDPCDDVLDELAQAERRAREHRELLAGTVTAMLTSNQALLEEVRRKVQEKATA